MSRLMFEKNLWSNALNNGIKSLAGFCFHILLFQYSYNSISNASIVAKILCGIKDKLSRTT